MPGWLVDTEPVIFQELRALLRECNRSIDNARDLVRRSRSVEGHRPGRAAAAKSPLADPDDRLHARAARGASRMNRVLLVASDNDTAEMYAIGLRVEGFPAAIVPDTATAMRFIRLGLLDAVVIDADDAVRDGWELVRSCRDGIAGHVLPVVVLTGHPLAKLQGLPELERAALLMKPCVPETLAQVLRALLDDSSSSGPAGTDRSQLED
jgi:CheY-like chemotaxis protein